jgi:hypothetical protein
MKFLMLVRDHLRVRAGTTTSTSSKQSRIQLRNRLRDAVEHAFDHPDYPPPDIDDEPVELDEPDVDTDVEQTSIDHKARRANSLASQGELSRAVDALTQASILPADARTIECLGKKMAVISNDKLAVLTPDKSKETKNPEPYDVVQAIMSLRPRSAGDLLGWTRELLMVLTRCPDVIDMLCWLLGDMNNGLISGVLHAYVNAFRALCTDKTSNGTFNIRPIGIPCIFSKLMEHVKGIDDEATKKLFPRIQLAIGRAGGSEVAAVLLRAQYQNSRTHNLNSITIQCDASNAFNSVTEQGVSETLLKHEELEPFRRHYWASRRDGGPLMMVYDQKGKLAASFRVPGVNQGSKRASIIYCAAQQSRLEQVQNDHPTTTLISIADDTTIHGPVDESISAYKQFSTEMSGHLNVKLDPKKAKVLWCGEGDPPADVISRCMAAGLPAPTTTITGLGTIISAIDAKYNEFAYDKLVPSITNVLELLKHKDITMQNRLTIIRHCVASRVNYLARTHSPDLIASTLEETDRLIRQSLHDLMDCTPDERNIDTVNKQIALPLHMGGLGVRQYKNSTARAAYVANVASAAHLIVEERRKRNITESDQDDELEIQLSHLVNELGVKIDDKLVPSPQNLASMKCTLIDFFAKAHAAGAGGGGVGKMQKSLQKQIDQANRARLMLQLDGSVDGEQHKARLKSLQRPECRMLYTVIPRSNKFRVPNEALQANIRVRVGLKAHPRLNVCSCGADHSGVANSHVYRCNSNAQSWCRMHDRVVYKFADIARQAGYLVDTRDFTEEKDEHHVVPDATITGGGERAVIDVSMVALSARDYVTAKINDTKPLARSAIRREQEKNKHYHTLVRDGSCVSFPLVFERESLAMGPDTLALIDKVESFSRGIASKGHIPRFTIMVQLLIAASIGSALLVDAALTKDGNRGNSQFRDLVVRDHPHHGFATTFRGEEQEGHRRPFRHDDRGRFIPDHRVVHRSVRRPVAAAGC